MNNRDRQILIFNSAVVLGHYHMFYTLSIIAIFLSIVVATQNITATFLLLGIGILLFLVSMKNEKEFNEIGDKLDESN